MHAHGEGDLMRILALFAIFIIAIMVFGCLGGTEPPPQQNQSNETNKTPIQIIIGEQKNQTTVKNETVEEEEELPPPPKTGLNYTRDPTANIGVFFIDVGGQGLQGDAILIKKGDMDILVDAGASGKGGKVVDFLRSHGVDDLEVLVSTNADPRHYGGMDAVAENFDIEEFWWSGEAFNDADYSALVNRLKAKAWKTEVVQDGFGAELNGINFTALNPPTRDTFDDINNDAIVLRMVDRNLSLLLTSGIQTGAQGRLINEKKEDIQMEIIQAPYYGVGQGTSNIGVFLINAKPKTMIISGSSDESAVNGGSRDPYKRLMTQYGIKWYENYKNGTIRIASDGSNYTISALGSGQ